jgi:hypothetical protein
MGLPFLQDINWEFFAAFCLASLVMISLFLLSEALRMLILHHNDETIPQWTAACCTGFAIPVVNSLALIFGFTGNTPDQPGFVNVLLLLPWAFVCWLLVLNMLSILGVLDDGTDRDRNHRRPG